MLDEVGGWSTKRGGWGGGLYLRIMYEILRPIFLQNRIYSNTNIVWLIMKIIVVFY